MNLLDTAEHLLRQAGGPLHVAEITRQAAEQGLMAVPVHSVDLVYAGLQRAIGEAGPRSPVVQRESGILALREWTSSATAARLDRCPGRLVVEVEAEASPSRPAATARALGAHVLSLIRQRPRQPAHARVHGYLRGLLGWGILNILGGLTLALRPRGSVSAGLSSTLLDWGSGQAALALGGLAQVQSEDRDAAAGILDGEALAERAGWYDQIGHALAVLGGVALVLGLLLGLTGRRAPRTRGRALGLLTQGSFLLTLFGLARWRQGSAVELQD